MENKKNFKYSPELYDMQIDWEMRLAREKIFFEKIIKENKINKILDIGCGTGHHAQLFSGMVRSVTAMDPSAEMVDYAAENVIKSSNVTLVKAGFEKLADPAMETFDMIVVLGNTIVLLENRRNVKAALKNIRKKLSPGGIAVLQFLNFEPGIIEKNRYYFPKICKKDSTKYIFMKHFEYGKLKTRADFLIIHINKDDEIEDFYKNTSFFCTLRKNIFLKMASNSGFKKIMLLDKDGNNEFNKKTDLSLYALLYNSWPNLQ